MPHRTTLAVTWAGWAVLAGCDRSSKEAEPATNPAPSDPDPDSGSAPVVEADPYVASVQASCPTGEAGTPTTLDAIRLDSAVTWSLDFDADAEAAGWVDCSYTREFSGVQRVDVDHICPHCEVIVEGEAVMTAGYDDCYAPLFGGEAARTETWGATGSDLFRRGASQLPLNEEPLTTLEAPSGDGTVVPAAWQSEYGVNDDDGIEVGRFILAASGTVAWAPDPSTPLVEPFGPRAEPYACGWECNDPGDLGGSYPLTPGAVVPNFRMRDQCGEDVDLHDFYGSYLVLDSAQSDCGPCLQMADQAEAFTAGMAAEGIPVRSIPLLGAGLSAVYATPTEETQAQWVERFEPLDPVLADRGWGYAAIGQYLRDHEGTDIAWPAWIVVGPDMQVITGAVGFGSWDTIAGIIRDDWETRGAEGPL